MIRWLFVALVLSGCAHRKPVAPVALVTTPGRCWAEGPQFLIGRQGSSVLASEALAYSGARTIRWIRPRQIVTTEFREDRLNITIDKREQVKTFTCG